MYDRSTKSEFADMTEICRPYEEHITCLCDQYFRVLKCATDGVDKGDVTETVLAATLLIAVILLFLSFVLHRLEKIYLSKDFQIPLVVWLENGLRRFYRRWKTSSKVCQTEGTSYSLNHTVIGITNINQEINHHLHIKKESQQNVYSTEFKTLAAKFSVEQETLVFLPETDTVLSLPPRKETLQTMPPYRGEDLPPNPLLRMETLYPTLPLLRGNLYPTLPVRREPVYLSNPRRKGNYYQYPTHPIHRKKLYHTLPDRKESFYPTLTHEPLYPTLPARQRSYKPIVPPKNENLYRTLQPRRNISRPGRKPLPPPVPPKGRRYREYQGYTQGRGSGHSQGFTQEMTRREELPLADVTCFNELPLTDVTYFEELPLNDVTYFEQHYFTVSPPCSSPQLSLRGSVDLPSPRVQHEDSYSSTLTSVALLGTTDKTTDSNIEVVVEERSEIDCNPISSSSTRSQISTGAEQDCSEFVEYFMNNSLHASSDGFK